MKSIFSLATLFFILSYFTLFSEIKETSIIAGQKVICLAELLQPPGDVRPYFMFLEDGSVWRGCDFDHPETGDIIVRREGDNFWFQNYNTNFIFKYSGCIHNEPFKIENVLIMFPFSDLEFQDSQGLDMTLTGLEKANFFMMSDQKIYHEGSYMFCDFAQWCSDESIHFFHDEFLDRDYFVSFQSKEIIFADHFDYQMIEKWDTNVQQRTVLLGEDTRSWCGDHSHIELLSSWHSNDRVIFQFPPTFQETMQQYGITKEVIVESTQGEIPYILDQLFFLQHKTPLDISYFINGDFRICFAMNLDTDQVLFFWDWIPPESP